MQDYKRIVELIRNSSSSSLYKLVLIIFLVAAFETLQLFFMFLIFSEFSGSSDSIQFDLVTNIFSSNKVYFYLSAIIASFTAGIFLIFSIIFTGLVAADISKNITVDLYNNLLDANFDISKFSSREEYQQAITKEGDTLSVAVLNPFFQLHIRLFSLLFIFIALMLVDINSTLISVFIVFIGYLIYLLLVKDFLYRFNIRKTILSTERLQLVSSIIYGKRDVHIFNLRKNLKKSMLEKSSEYFKGYAYLHIFGLLPRFLFESFTLASICIIFLISYLNPGSFSLASFGVIAIALIRVLPMFQAIFGNYASLRGNTYCLYFFEKLNKNLEKESKFFADDTTLSKENLITKFNTIELRDVAVKASTGKEIFRNLNISLEPGKKYLIYGPSGSGKSTFVDCLIGLIPISSGTISIDNKKIDSLKNIDISCFSAVSQKVSIFEGSILYNITFSESESNIDKERLESVIKISKIDNYLSNLDLGLKTMISESGSKLSGGQLQRIAIARSLYKKSSILILDEATNGLEEELEKEILNEIENFYEGTIIYISHNSSYKTRVDHLINI